MDPSSSNLQKFFIGYSTIFQKAYGEAEIFWPKIATLVPSTHSIEEHGWMARSGRMREWLGERQVNEMAGRRYELKNKDWERTEKIPRNAFEDDTFGLYNDVPAAMGAQAAKWPDDMIADLLLSNPNGFDGRPFFDASHPTNMNDASLGVQANLFTGKAFNPTNYAFGKSKMRQFRGDDNRPMRGRGTLLVVPPALEESANVLLNGDFIAPNTFAGQTNVGNFSNTMKGSAELLVIDELGADFGGSDTTWYLIDNSKPLKPFIFQQRKPVQFVYKNKPDDDNVFWQKEFIYGMDARGVAGVSLWFLAAKFTA